MSNVIDFLERMGQDANLRQAIGDEMEKALTNANIAPELRAAIFNENQRDLEKLLGAKTNVCCMIQPVSDEEDAVEDSESAASRRVFINSVA